MPLVIERLVFEVEEAGASTGVVFTDKNTRVVITVEVAYRQPDIGPAACLIWWTDTIAGARWIKPLRRLAHAAAAMAIAVRALKPIL